MELACVGDDVFVWPKPPHEYVDVPSTFFCDIQNEISVNNRLEWAIPCDKARARSLARATTSEIIEHSSNAR